MSAVTIDDMAELVRASGRELRTVDLGPDNLSPRRKLSGSNAKSRMPA
jgi:hypothetical protein